MLGMSAPHPLAPLLVPLLAAGLLAPPALLGQPAGGLATFLDTVEVRVVNVDVVVLDADGRPVTGLSREDFELFEDGKPVELSNFAAFEEAAAASAGTATFEPGATAAEIATAEAPRAAPPATWVVYLDQSALQPGPRNQVLKETRDFLTTSLATGDRAMVATFDGKSLKIVSNLSADRASALGALEILTRQVGSPSGIRGQASQIQRDIQSVDLGSPSAVFEAENALREIEAAAEEMALRSRAALDSFRDLLAIVAGVEGRVAVLYAGGGFESDPAANLYQLWEARFRGLTGVGAASTRDRDPNTTQARLDYARLLKAVNASRVTVYTIFAGEGRGPDVSAEIGGTPGSSGPSLSINSPEGGSSLAAFATETGGRAFVGAPDLADRLESARQDLATYYSLGYHPEGSDPGAFHELTVRVRRDGLRVVHRRGVTERAPEEVAGDAATAALLAAAPPENPFGAALEIGAASKAKGAGRGSLVPVSVRVPLRGLTLLPDGAVHRAQLAFHFSLRDPDGGFRRLEPRPLEFSVPNEKLAASLNQSIAFKVDLVLEPGVYQIAVAVVDRLGGASSAATAGFEVAKAR